MPESNPNYARDLAEEGQFWTNFIADRLLRHDEIPGSVDFRIFFTEYSYKHNWGPPCLGPIAINFREREIRYILEQATKVPGARVLDLGCGSGWLSLELARQGAHVTALDISRTNLVIARHMANTNARNFPFLYQKFAGLPCSPEQFGSVEYIYSDLNSVELPRQEFDAVVVWDSLHHVQNLEHLLDQVRASLKPGGVFVGVDHAFATPLTISFNETVGPWLTDINDWLASRNPEWLYKKANDLAAQYQWGVLGVDYDVHPIPGFEAFQAQVRDELLSILRSELPQERTARHDGHSAGADEHISPFEDVSAEHVMQALIDNFEARYFRTICPLITPEQYFSPPRSEPERIFQHYLSALILEFNEQAIRQQRADGQWLLFHLTAERPNSTGLSADLSRLRSNVSRDSIARDLEESRNALANKTAYISELEAELAGLKKPTEESTSYVSHVEAELARKNDAINDLERRVEQLELDLSKARAPRLPWKGPSR